MSSQQPIALEQLDAEAEADRLLEEDDLAQQASKGDSKHTAHADEDGFEQELGELEEGELGLPRPATAIKPVSSSLYGERMHVAKRGASGSSVVEWCIVELPETWDGRLPHARFLLLTAQKADSL